MVEKKRILYMQTSGTDTPMRLYSPIVLATVAASMNIEATVFFLGKGLTAVKKGEPEKIQMGTFPPLSDVMKRAVNAGVRLLVCDQSTQLMGLSRGDYIDGAEVVGAATLNDLALDADAVLSF
ncbi:MAG: DsrE family protein [Candidatus Eisenbacteria bacterium]|nr:DsrE family protein [Candidatus Eisenbacteria bacterium]